ncbi:universal stress protein [Streptomyces kunmingensis]|uniref:Universal stress protein n=1 Tax=Streptomyces kunmingensis TaxID=68225 RepID=A0ABU6CD86_9ACTN|nr:universal stress protein [Streptomyces kunmingensis]MEB3962679.1 universal stress protein [Streptomyces kunmingensis]
MLRPVVVGVDDSAESLAAAEWAAQEACLRDLPLRLVHAWNWSPHPASDVPADAAAVGAAQRVRARAMLDEAETRARAACPRVRMTADPLEGPASAALLRAAEQAEVMVLGSRGLAAFTGVVVGSVAQSVAAASPVPLVLVRAGEPRWACARVHFEGEVTSKGKPERPCADVVLGLDLADPCDEVVEFALTAARARGVRLRVLSAWRSPALYTLGPGELALAEKPRREEEWRGFQDAVLRSWRGKFPEVEVVGTVVEGRIVTPLLGAAEDACLLVVGRHAHAGHRLGQHNGPVTHAVMHHARCPVAIVPYP